MRARADVPAINFMLMLAGLWLIASAFAFSYQQLSPQQENDFFTGFTVLTVAFICAISVPAARWLSWVNIILGIWLILTPFALGYANVRVPQMNDMILGVIVTGLAIWSVIESRRVPTGVG